MIAALRRWLAFLATVYGGPQYVLKNDWARVNRARRTGDPR